MGWRERRGRLRSWSLWTKDDDRLKAPEIREEVMDRFKVISKTTSVNTGIIFVDEKSRSWAFVAEDPEQGTAVNGMGSMFGHIDDEKRFSTAMNKSPDVMAVAEFPGIIKDDWVTIVPPGTIFSNAWVATEKVWEKKADG